jgi:nitrogen PTS system EIIA component
MNPINLIRPECVRAAASAPDRESVLRLIAAVAAKNPSLSEISEDALFDALLEREKLGSTAFGGGIAIPHCRLPDVPEFVVGIVTVPDRVEFKALDNEPVRLFVFIIAPSRESNEHIRVLSSISQVLRIPGAVGEMVREETDTGLLESFLRHCRDDVDSRDHAAKNLFHVLIQREEWFEEILQVFAAMDSCSVMVVESEQSGTYLRRLPLFSGFFSDAERGFNRMIIATVEKKMTNESIRRIEQICGSLESCEDVLVTIQDVFYTNGHLKT